MGKGYTYGVATFATFGALLFGYDSGIISTTLAQDDFISYFGNPSATMIGAIVSTYAGGQGVGNLTAGWSMDAIGRRDTILVAAIIGFVGGALQAGSVNIKMFLAARIIAGFACGLLVGTTSVYNAEIAPPKSRGFVVGLQAQVISSGYCVANWIGYACSFAGGSYSWRVPLALQCLPAGVLLIGIWWLPYSPRWLMQKGRFDEAYRVVKRLHGGYADDPEFHQREFDSMKEQIEYETNIVKPTWSEIITKASYRKRFIFGILIQSFVQLSGVNVINYYQTTMYKSLGITGRSVLFVSCWYGCMGPLANLVCIFFVDKWGRRKPLGYLSIALGVDMIIFTALTAKYTMGELSTVGAGFAIACIFAFSIIFSLGYNTIQFVFQSEIFPLHLRARGVAVATVSATIWNIVFNQASPSAFISIGWKYYIVFICTNLVAGFVFLVFFPETKGLSLEEMAILFGDDVIIAPTSEEAIKRGLHSTAHRADGTEVTHSVGKEGVVHEENEGVEKLD